MSTNDKLFSTERVGSVASCGADFFPVVATVVVVFVHPTWQLADSGEDTWQLADSGEDTWQLADSGEDTWQLADSCEDTWQLADSGEDTQMTNSPRVKQQLRQVGHMFF